jgi:sugar lactone lactonase YvrE
MVLAAGVAALSALAAHAEQTRLAATTAAALEDGESQGIAVTSKGHLFLAPRIAPLGKPAAGPWPAQVFTSAADAAGNVFLATGPDGVVVRVTPAGDSSTYFRTDEPLVTALLVLPGGDLLVAAAPGGTIYRVRPDGQGTAWCESGERYVWALATAPDGGIFAATGEHGRLLEIDRNGKASVAFDSDETHLVSLAPAKGGGVWAGGSGRGLVYRIDAEGHGLVVYDDDLPEAKAIAVEASGALVVAFDAPPVSERRPPAVRIRVAGGGTRATEGIEDLESRETPALQGVIEGLPAEIEDDTARVRGKVVRITAEGTATELWRSTTEAPFALALDEDGRPIIATGEPARLWRVENASEVALLVTLKEAQATALVRQSRGFVVATSNPAATYRLERDAAEVGTYLAPISDAGGVARWGMLTWRSEAGGGRVELFARTGNCEAPDGTWSAWSQALVDGRGAPLPNPEGRFLQWRVRMAEATGEGPRIGSVAATYATRNRPPAVRDLRIEPATGAVSGKATVRWAASDPDGDGVAVEIQARLEGTSAWKSAARLDPTPLKMSDPSLGNDASSRDGKATWETATWDEGIYEVRAAASDQASNPPGEGQDTTTDLALLVRIDRTPPSFETTRSARDGLDVVVTDAVSSVARLEIVEDGRALFSARPLDGVCDGPRETFHLTPAETGAAGTRSLRATDAAGNAAEIAMPTP